MDSSRLETPNRLVDSDDIDTMKAPELELQQIGIVRDHQIGGCSQRSSQDHVIVATTTAPISLSTYP